MLRLILGYQLLFESKLLKIRYCKIFVVSFHGFCLSRPDRFKEIVFEADFSHKNIK